MTEQRNRDAGAIIVNLARPSRGVGAISAYLQRAIETGAYSEGDRLPPERQLAATFQAARSTVRRALDQLEKTGLVSRRLGSGTFVGAASPDFPCRPFAVRYGGRTPASARYRDHS